MYRRKRNFSLVSPFLNKLILVSKLWSFVIYALNIDGNVELGINQIWCVVLFTKLGNGNGSYTKVPTLSDLLSVQQLLGQVPKLSDIESDVYLGSKRKLTVLSNKFLQISCHSSPKKQERFDYHRPVQGKPSVWMLYSIGLIPRNIVYHTDVAVDRICAIFCKFCKL